MSTLETVGHLDRLLQQTILARFAEMALTTHTLDDVLTEACRLAGQAVGADLTKVMELQNDRETLLVRAGIGWKPGAAGGMAFKAIKNSPEGHAIMTGEPAVSPDIEYDTRFERSPTLADNGVRAVANVPIVGASGRPAYGILQVAAREKRDFSGDIGFLASFAKLIGSAVDRLRVMSDIRKGEERLALALDGARLGQWEINLASGVITGTPRVLQIFGYAGPPARWGYESFLNQVLPEERADVVTALRAAADTGAEWRFECRIRHGRSGQVRWVEAQGRATGGIGGAPSTHLLGIVADVTGRKTKEAALQHTNEVLEEKVAERTLRLTEANARLLGAQAGQDFEWQRSPSSSGEVQQLGHLLTEIGSSLEQLRLCAAQGRTAEIEPWVAKALSSVKRANRLTCVSDRVALPAAAEAGAARNPAVILVVDDEETLRMTVRDVLCDLGCTVLEAGDGPSGLKLAGAAAQLDLLIADIGLPDGMTGQQLAAEARRQRPGLQVLFITGYSEDAVPGGAALDSGMQVMIKPFRVEALAKRVRSMVRL